MSVNHIAITPDENEEALQEFITQEGFVLVVPEMDLFECPGGHIWHIDQILDHMNECLRESCL